MEGCYFPIIKLSSWCGRHSGLKTSGYILTGDYFKKGFLHGVTHSHVISKTKDLGIRPRKRKLNRNVNQLSNSAYYYYSPNIVYFWKMTSSVDWPTVRKKKLTM